MKSLPSGLISIAGRRYLFERLIRERPYLARVWLETSGKDKYILKDISKNVFSHSSDSRCPRLCDSPQLRSPCDTIPDKQIHVSKYLTDDFWVLAGKQISMQSRKQILKTTLMSIAELHDEDIVHLNVKPQNIMVDCRYVGQDMSIDRVRVMGLENSWHLPMRKRVRGMLTGNENWRSPEAHMKGELNKPSDMFSFGAVCIYAVLGRVIFGHDEDFDYQQAAGGFPTLIRMQRQVSYFGDQAGVDGLLKFVDDSPLDVDVLRTLWQQRLEGYLPYKPFLEWPDVQDMAFKDLVSRMMNLDPLKRITARQALEHPWISSVEI